MRMQHLKRRHKKMHRSPILKNKEARRNQRRNPRQGLSASARWRTGHRCPVCTGLSGEAPDSLRREAAERRSLAVAPDCPVCTGLSGVHRTVRCARSATVGNGRLRHLRKGIGHRTLSGVHRTVRCARRQKARMAFQICSQRLLAALGL